MKTILTTLLALAAAVALVGIAGYAWLAPEEPPTYIPAQETVKTIEGGEIIGYQNDLGVSVWQGIPYAAAPVGELRWKAPRAVLPWEGQLQALLPGNECATQPRSTSSANHSVDGNEDCLFLNVFAPANADNLPVMYWIHGGANTRGSGSIVLYEGSLLASRQQVVLVSINYRLGNFGWLSHPALRSADASLEDNSGNYGTLDQIKGLQWVRDNIAQFGGNPDKVTIFGESAGGWNVLALMASPLAKDLFHGAIVQSGGLDIDPVWVAENFVDDEQAGSRLSSREIINQLFILDGSASDARAARAIQEAMPATELAQYLRAKSTAEIFAAYRSEDGGLVTMLPDLIGDGHVLPAGVSSQQLFSEPVNYNAVPVMLGTNHDEMKLFLSFNPDMVNTLMGIPTGIKDLQRYDKFNRYSTDRWKVIGVDRLATVMRAGQGENVFAYRFDAKDLRDFGLIDLRDLLGAAHALEIPYVFGNFPKPFSVMYPSDTHEARDALSASMMSYWAEFAYNGKPGRGRDGREQEWTGWVNEGEDSNRLMILDSTLGGGIRMSPERISIDDLKQRLFSDGSFADQEEYCMAYETLFLGEDFDPREYESLGADGCSS
ncbi:MAG: carboxylesterase family protein [Halioglobus sp.]|nr:carboxylesterase family protein [Halioglobus sp.]